MRRRITAVLLCFCVLLAGTAGLLPLYADSVQTGIVCVNDSLNVRKEASTGSAVIGSLYNGDPVTVNDTVTAGGMIWYKIPFGSSVGYVCADYITLRTVDSSDGDFEGYLTAQGFPESYKAGLRTMHAAHPKWVFRAQQLAVDWTAAVNAESKVGASLIESPEAWCSMEYGAYNWSTKKYVAFDSGRWYSATRDVVAYYMDPRPFLNDTYVFQFENLGFSADQTEAGVKAILPTAIASYAAGLIKAGKEAGVSAYFMAAKIVQEGTVKNGLATGSVAGYKGYYNLFDIGAYAHDGRSAVENGAIYAKNHGWTSPEKCALDSAKDNFASSYISRGQNTTYYQRFNVVSPTYYNHQYMTNVAGAAGEGNIMYRNLSGESLECAHTFVIPVYKNMPSAASPKPSQTGNNNNFLEKITLSSGSLTPTFDRYTMNYAVQVNSSVSTLTVTVTKSNSGAAVTGAGTVKLNAGVNTVPITVTATSGAKRTYTLTVTRSGNFSTPTVTGKTYTVGTAVTKVEPQTPLADFIRNLAVSGGTEAVYSAAGSAKTGGYAATGDILRLYNGSTLCASYPILVYGDCNGDGKINSQDLRTAQKHIIGASKLSGYPLTAADTTRDGKLTSQDLRTTQKYILGMTKSLQ